MMGSVDQKDEPQGASDGQRRRRTLGTDDELRVLGEIAVIASRVEFLTRELLIALIDPSNPDVGVELTRGWRFDRCAGAAQDLLPRRFPSDESPRGISVQALARCRSAMNDRNQYLH